MSTNINKHIITCVYCYNNHRKCNKKFPTCNTCSERGEKCVPRYSNKKRGRPFGNKMINMIKKKSMDDSNFKPKKQIYNKKIKLEKNIQNNSPNNNNTNNTLRFFYIPINHDFDFICDINDINGSLYQSNIDNNSITK